jgi:hypothetical protein
MELFRILVDCVTQVQLLVEDGDRSSSKLHLDLRSLLNCLLEFAGNFDG